MPELPVQEALEAQAQNVKDEFNQRYQFSVGQLAEQGLNACVFYENRDVRSFINMVPTSAISGDGMMDLLFLLTTLPSRMLVDKIMYHENLECTVLEVKAIEGLGTTMDVVVVNGDVAPGTCSPRACDARAHLTHAMHVLTARMRCTCIECVQPDDACGVPRMALSEQRAQMLA